MKTTQPELFPLADNATTPKKPKRPQNDRVRYTSCTYRRRILCDDCVRAIHSLGFAVAPPPLAVRWRRTCGDEVMLLCAIHKREREEGGA